MRMFLDCMGRGEWFLFDLENPFLPFDGGVAIKLGFFNPFRLSTNIVAFAFIFVVPVFYFKIFLFRKKQDSSVQGTLKYVI